MFKSQPTDNSTAKLQALDRSQAVIEFNMDGTIITANENFLGAVGYALEEIQSKHHRMFVEPDYAESAEYKAFWDKLREGKFDSGEYKRFGKGGKEIWIQASYNPILDKSGKPVRVVKFATDITAQKLINADYTGQIDAISKSQAVIEFNLDGTIINANSNFLNAVGYSLDEIKGKPGIANGPTSEKAITAHLQMRIADKGWRDCFENAIRQETGKVIPSKGAPTKDELFTEIAQRHLGVETLERRMSDSLDFHDIDVSSIRAALEAAFEAGKAAAKKGA